MASFKVGALKDDDVCVPLQEKIKEMFENLMQVEHPNIVKFHKYWLDMKESQARVCMFFFFPSFLLLKHSNSSSVSFLTGHLHHRIHVLWQLKAISEKNKEKSQDHECEGQLLPLFTVCLSVCLWWRSRVLQPRPRQHRIVDYVTKHWSVGFFKYSISNLKCTMSHILGLEEMVHPDSVCPQVWPLYGFFPLPVFHFFFWNKGLYQLVCCFLAVICTLVTRP